MLSVLSKEKSPERTTSTSLNLLMEQFHSLNICIRAQATISCWDGWPCAANQAAAKKVVRVAKITLTASPSKILPRNLHT